MDSNKNDLFALYLKHDENFSTISKFSLSELIMKILYFHKKPMSIGEINTKLNELLVDGKVTLKQVQDAITCVPKKIRPQRNNKYVLSEDCQTHIKASVIESDNLHHEIYVKYFSQTDQPEEIIISWFKNLMVSFFEKYNFEWFHVVTYKVNDKSIYNIDDVLQSAYKKYRFSEKDIEWLNRQFKQFVQSNEPDVSNIFWQYGLAAFSSRLISASTFANKINVKCLEGMTFLLDTNVLMALGLEKHKLHDSFEVLEKCFNQLDVKLEYLYITKEEYRRAMSFRREELCSVFDDYNENVLRVSDCPFIRTALYRQCQNADDIKRMFETIESVPEYFSDNLSITINENEELIKAIEASQQDAVLQTELNNVYKRLKGRDKREAALIHDIGLIGAGKYLRGKNPKYAILTNDTVLKSYAAQKLKRNDITLAIGLDVVIGLLTIANGGIDADATQFAPLFKNIILSSLTPSKDAFQVEDLAFMLGAHLEINKLPTEQIVEIAKEVNQKLSAGEPEENIRWFLRQKIEGARLQEHSDVVSLRTTAEQAVAQRDEAVQTNIDFTTNVRSQEQQAEIKRRIRKTIGWWVLFVVFVAVIVVLECIVINNPVWKYVVAGITPILSIFIGYFPINKLISKNYARDMDSINEVVDKKIQKLKQKQ